MDWRKDSFWLIQRVAVRYGGQSQQWDLACNSGGISVEAESGWKQGIGTTFKKLPA